MRRLLTAGDLLPERAGQPVKAWAHISLADLLLPGWQLRAAGRVDRPGPGAVGRVPREARPRPAATAARGWTVTPPGRSRAMPPWRPIVTGDLDPGRRWTTSIRLCVELDRLRQSGEDPNADAGDPAPGQPAEECWSRPSSARLSTYLSGPGGLASFLRRRQLGARLGGPSLPLDIGVQRDHPGGRSATR